MRYLCKTFSKRFNEATELELEKLWDEMNENFELYIRFGVYESPAFNFENPSAQEIFRTVLIDAAKYEGTRPLKSVRENKVYTFRNHALKSITCDAFLNLSERGSQLIFELFLNSLNVS